MSSPVEVIENICPNNTKLKEKSVDIKNKFTRVFTMFAQCHHIYSSGTNVTDKDSVKLGKVHSLLTVSISS